MKSDVPEEKKRRERKPSTFGVASLALGLVPVVGLLLLAAAWPSLRMTAPMAPFLLLGVLCLLLGSPIGIVLGVVALRRHEERKAVAIVGLVLNGILALPLIWVMGIWGSP